MRNILLLFVFLSVYAWGQAQMVRTCHANENQTRLENANPGLASTRARIEQFTQRYMESHEGNTGSEAVYTIPVVVHVVYYNTTQNISDAQIQSQIAILNQDFRRTNADASSTPTGFAGISADCEINFCLATVDPSGNPTTGITRTSTTVNGFSDNDAMKSSSTGGKTAWPAGSYLNLWVVNLSGSLLGYAQFPGGPSATDGVVIDYQYFGNIGTATAPFNKGRTATHEVGHWLNLYHIWGDDADGNGTCSTSSECSGSDGVSDTPNQCEMNYGCPSFPRTDGCTSTGNGVMFMNYMDYTDDACMNMFTAGQKSRMQAQLATGGSRASLASSGGCGGGTVTGYCTSQGNSVADEWIQTVAIGSFTNNSGANGGYGNFTSSTISLTKGVATSFTLTPGFSGTAYSEYWKIWVDLNADNDFDDTGELVYDAGSTATTARTGTITIPTSATATTTRMRVSMKYNGAQTACEAFSYGEVEDYTVSLSGATACGTPTGMATSSITSGGATFGWTAVSGATSYNVRYKATSASTWTSTTSTTTSKAVTGLTAATAYEWQVQAVCSGGSSAFTASTNFTTSAATCTDAYEPNETSGAYKTISVNTDITGRICTTTDKDWYRFSTTSTAPKVQVTLTTLPADYDVRLYNSSVSQLGISQNSGTTSETIKYNTSTAAATYYIQVYGYNGANSSTAYTLRASTRSTNWRQGEPGEVEEQAESTDEAMLEPVSEFLVAFPNPATDAITLLYVTEMAGPARFSLVDMLGREYLVSNQSVVAGENKLDLNLSELAEGIYLVRVATESGVQTAKIHVVK